MIQQHNIIPETTYPELDVRNLWTVAEHEYSSGYKIIQGMDNECLLDLKDPNFTLPRKAHIFKDMSDDDYAQYKVKNETTNALIRLVSGGMLRGERDCNEKAATEKLDWLTAYGESLSIDPDETNLAFKAIEQTIRAAQSKHLERRASHIRELVISARSLWFLFGTGPAGIYSRKAGQLKGAAVKEDTRGNPVLRALVMDKANQIGVLPDEYKPISFPLHVLVPKKRIN